MLRFLVLTLRHQTCWNVRHTNSRFHLECLPIALQDRRTNKSIRTSFMSICNVKPFLLLATPLQLAARSMNTSLSFCLWHVVRGVPCFIFQSSVNIFTSNFKNYFFKSSWSSLFISTKEVLQPFDSQYFVYIRYKSPAKIETSSPPVPARFPP